MSEYQMGRDLQELRSRVERLEVSLESPGVPGRGGIGQAGQTAATINPNTKPTIWQAEEYSSMPPLFSALLGLPPGSKIERAQSKSWTVVPEPLIQNVFWSDGRIEEYFRFQNQLVTLTRYNDPTTGGPTAVANFSATVVASGKAKPRGPGDRMVFHLNLLNAQGGFLHHMAEYFSIDCHDNRPFVVIGRFFPDLYDIADRFHFYFGGDIQLVSC